MLGHEDLVEDDVLGSGAAHPEGEPRVVDGDLEDRRDVVAAPREPTQMLLPKPIQAFSYYAPEISLPYDYRTEVLSLGRFSAKHSILLQFGLKILRVM